VIGDGHEPYPAGQWNSIVPEVLRRVSARVLMVASFGSREGDIPERRKRF
jgi:hypothetical protein